MAKKSAMSKGYRKTIKSKPFLTKNEIIALVVIVIAVIVGIFVVDAVSKAGTITAKQVENTDIVGFASTEMRDRYVKLGTVTDLEGYVREGGPTEEAPTTSHTYTPTDENAAIDYASISTSVYDANTAADITMSYYTGTLDLSEKFETTVYGMPATVFSASGSYYDESIETEETEEAAAEETAEEVTEEAVAEEPAPNVFTQSLSMYITVDEDHSIAIHAYVTGEDESCFIPDDQVVDTLQGLTGAIVPLSEK